MQENLTLMGVNQNTSENINDLFSNFESNLSPVIDEIYNRLSYVGEDLEIFKNDEKLNLLKERHKAHILDLGHGLFNENFQASAQSLGANINDLPPNFIMASYAFLLENLMVEAVSKTRFNRKKLVEKLSSAIKSVFFDLTMVMSDLPAPKENIDETFVGEETAPAAAPAFDTTQLTEKADNIAIKLARITDMCNQNTDGTETDSADLKKTTQAIFESSKEASSNVETVSTAAEELSTSISEISRQVAQSSALSSEAVEKSQLASETVSRLVDASEKIGQIVKLINDIAGQTNLLALNATIEAARAQEAGKGFAVVASEVKNLASQTSKATEDITSQVGDIQAITNGAVEAIEAIRGAITSVNQTSSAIAGAVEQQDSATQEIARNVAKAASSTRHVSEEIHSIVDASSDGSVKTEIQDMVHEITTEVNALKALIA